MNLPIKIAGLSYEAIDGRVHIRKQDVKSEVTTGLSDLALAVANTEDGQESETMLVLDYRHFVSAKETDGAPFYDAAVHVRVFLDVDRAVYPIDGDAVEFLDHALSLLMPMTGQKLRSICFDLGISPVPSISFRPIRAEKKAESTAIAD